MDDGLYQILLQLKGIVKSVMVNLQKLVEPEVPLLEKRRRFRTSKDLINI